TPISQCNQDSNGNRDMISEVVVDCGVAGKGVAHILGAPVLGNPPSTSLMFDPPPDAPKAFVPPPTWTFEAVVSMTTPTSASLICRAPVTVAANAPDDQIVSATAAAINAAPQCKSAGVKATANIVSSSTGEDSEGTLAPSVTVQASGMSGSELFVTFRSAPGGASGLCFDLAGLGDPTLHQTAIMQTVIQTAAGGAAGGTIRFMEGTDIGVCKRDVTTTAGMTADQVATAIGQAFTSVTSPGPADCIARNNALDVEVGHLGQSPNTLFTVISHKLQVCSFDPGIGFAVTPDTVDVSNSPPDCSTVTATPSQLWPPDHKFVSVALSNATDPDGDPVTTTVTEVRQDENPNGQIDAQLAGCALSLRAERDGRGDGRVYHVTFSAADSQGASCSGEVTVCVPHDQGKLSCGDQGPIYPSGVP
ncbi:MAG: Ig-like domain-containing protein, partial [Polyangiaceae bacterium]